MIPLSDTTPGRRFAPMTLLLVLACFYVYFVQVTTANPDAFFSHYALVPAAISLSNPSSLAAFVTAIFLHGGLLHIVTNMLFLWVFGRSVESKVGSFSYLGLFLIGGAAGNVAQYLVSPHSDIPMVGASGAIAAVLGAFFVFFPGKKILTLVPILIFPLFLRIPARALLLLWFILQLVSGAGSLAAPNQPGVAYFAHICGFVIGIAYARAYTTNASAIHAIT